MATRVTSAADRLYHGGVAAGSTVDLVAVGFSRSEEDSEAAGPMARDILTRYSKLSSLAEASPDELGRMTGFDRYELLQAQALIELGRRMNLTKRGELPEVDRPEDIFNRLSYLQNEKREHFLVVLLDSKGQITRIAPIHIGTINMSIVGAREVFREAVRDGASSIIVAHNHPSGDPSPSPEDIEVTSKLIEVGDLLDIPVLDHIIIGYGEFTSLSRSGLLCKRTGNRS